jgi:hypothetical protein
MSDLYQDGRAIISRPGNGPVLSRGVPSLAVDGGALGAAVRVPMLDAQAAGMPGRAIAAGGAALGEASDAMGQLAAAQLRMVNERRVYEAEAAMDEMRSTIAARLVNEPDETKWGDIAETEAEAARGVILTDDLSPEARDAIGLQFIRWKSNTVGQTRIQSFRETRKKLVERKQAEVIRATHAGDMERVKGLTQGMVAQGLIGADEAAQTEIQAEGRRKQLDEEVRTTGKKESLNRFTEALDADPWAARDAIDNNFFPDFDEVDKARAKADADQAIAARQRDVIQQVRDGIIAGAPDTDETGIEKWGETARLGAEDVAGLKEFRTKFGLAKLKNEPLDRDAVAQLFGEIAAYDGSDQSDPKAVKWGSLLQRVEVLTAAGGEEGRLAHGALIQSLSNRHPYRSFRGAADPGLPEGVSERFAAAMDAVAADDGFGPVERVVQKMVPNASGVLTASGYEKKPNPDAAYKRVKAQTALKKEIEADAKANPDKWRDLNYLDEWLFGKDGKSGRLGYVKAGGAVEKMRGGGDAPVGPDGSLFPGGVDTYGDPTPEGVRNIINK